MVHLRKSIISWNTFNFNLLPHNFKNMNFISVTILFIEALFLADLMSGVVHWLEDTYGNPNWKFLGLGKHVVVPNLVHHYRQRDLVKGNWFDRIWTSAVFLLIVLLILWAFGLVNQLVCLTFSIAVWGNEVHCWSHRSPKENGKIITFLQRNYIIQSPKQHAKHHISPYACDFCAMTPYLNPILEATKFWRILEFILGIFFIKPNRGKECRMVDGKYY